MASVAELNAGVNVLKTYVDNIMNDAGEAWEENFIPAEFYVAGCADIINVADRGTQTAASRQANGEIALRNALQSSGYSSRISDAQVTGAVQVVLQAIGALRADQECDR
jgi:hypothetical protein